MTNWNREFQNHNLTNMEDNNYDMPDMGDSSNNDVCSLFASIINQRRQVERLLNWLRESQTTCTESNCFDDHNGLPAPEYDGQLGNNVDESGTFSLVILFVVGVLTLFAMSVNRNHQLNSREGTNKESRSNNGSNDDDHNGFRRNNDDDDDHHSRPAL